MKKIVMIGQLPNKIYIVIGRFGSWGDATTRHLNAFYSIEDAEKYVEKANRILNCFSKHIQEQHYISINGNYNMEECNRALNISQSHDNLEDFKYCLIEEIKIK